MRNIGILKNGTITFVEYDGPGRIGAVLRKNYNTLDKIQELVAKGDILGTNEEGLFHHHENHLGPHQTDSLDKFDEGSENYLFNCDQATSSNGYIKQGQWTHFYTNYTRSGEASRRRDTLYV